MRIDGIQPGNPIERPITFTKSTSDNQAPSFKDTLAKFLNNVNDSQKASSDAQLKLLSGETNDVHQVMHKSEEATLNFNMLMELRNKTLDGYREIIQIRL